MFERVRNLLAGRTTAAPVAPVRMSSPIDRPSPKPETAGYVSIAAQYQPRPRDLPPLGFDMIRSMLLDPAVRLGLQMRIAPICGVEIAYNGGAGPDGKVKWVPGVLASRPEVGEFVRRQLARIWTHGLEEILTAQVWGWSAGEVMLRLTSRGSVEIDYLLGRHAIDTRALIRGGTVIGARVMRVTSAAGGNVDLEFNEAKGWFHSYRPEAGAFYGQSILLGCYSPYADKCFQGGATDVRRLFMHADAYGGKDMTYPDGVTRIGNEEVANRDLAMQIIEQLQAGGVTARPAIFDANGNELWRLTRATVASNPAHILQFPKDLDTEIYHGLEIPDDVIESDTGAWAGKRIPMAAFYNSLDLWVMSILGMLTEQLLEPLVLMNFGRAEEFAVTHKPLGQQAMEQQANAGPGSQQPTQQQSGQTQQPPGGNPQQQYQQGMPPNPQQQPQPMPGQIRLGIDPVEAVGHGVLNAAELVHAAREVIDGRRATRMANDDPSGTKWVTIGGRRDGSDEHAGGFPVQLDENGVVLKGGPKGLRGKHVSKIVSHFKKMRNTPQQKAKRAESTIKKQAKSWDMSPEQYKQFSDQIWRDKTEEHKARESAKADARKSLGVTAGDVRRLEEQGFDYGSGKIKGLDTIGRELASQYPALNWGGGYGDESGGDVNDTDYDSKVWELLKEGKQELPAKDSPEFHAEVDEYLSYLASQSGIDDSKDDQDDDSPIPFSLEGK